MVAAAVTDAMVSSRMTLLTWPGRGGMFRAGLRANLVLDWPRAGAALRLAEDSPVTTASSSDSSSNDKIQIVASISIEPQFHRALWSLYRSSMAHLEDRAILDQSLHRDTFEGFLKDDRVTKTIAWRGDVPVGIAAMTNCLELVPMLSVNALRARYPELVAREALYYAAFICIDPNERARSLFATLVAPLMRIVGSRDGVAIYDVSQFSEEHGVARTLNKLASWFPGGSSEPIDRQVYYALTLPNPMDELPFGHTRIAEVVYDVREDLVDRPTDPVDRAGGPVRRESDDTPIR
jgi:hypothetical protein